MYFGITIPEKSRAILLLSNYDDMVQFISECNIISFENFSWNMNK